MNGSPPRIPLPARASLALACLVVIALAAQACSELTTPELAEGDVFDAPLPGLSRDDLAAFARGDAEFGRRFSPATGLGPIFNNASCAACHSGDGRGRLENALRRIGSPDDDLLRALGGPQIQDKAITGATPEAVPNGHAVSVRLPPPAFGTGLIEAIPDEVILAGADPDDADGDGISGRANRVTLADFVPETEPGATQRQRVGRFGRKAQVASLLQQVAGAYHQDMGITSDFTPTENRNPLAGPTGDAADHVPDPEIPAATVLAVTHYVRLLAPPAAGADTPLRQEGRAIFQQIRCTACHTPALPTGPNAIPALADQQVQLYSDLLLHDMGDALADNRPDGEASGREWRTTPLWGLRLMRRFLNGDAFLLHDGRARSVEEAILMHGGEAAASREAFRGLTPAARAALLDFVESR